MIFDYQKHPQKPNYLEMIIVMNLKTLNKSKFAEYIKKYTNKQAII